MKCKKCNKAFKIPENAIEPVYAIYCKSCIYNTLKKSLKLTTKEIIKINTKQIFNLKL